MRRFQFKKIRVFLAVFLAAFTVFIVACRSKTNIDARFEELGGEIVSHEFAKEQFANHFGGEFPLQGDFLHIWNPNPEVFELTERLFSRNNKRIQGLVVELFEDSEAISVIPKIAGLKYLSVSRTTVSSSELDQFDSLVRLSLRNCRMVDSGRNMRPPVPLEFVDVSGCELHDFSWLGDLQDLKHLRMRNTTLHTEELEKLGLKDSTFPYKELKHLASCEQIRSLDVAHTGVTCDELWDVKSLHNLTSLSIGPQDSPLTCLKNFSKLESLSLYDRTLFHSEIELLGELPELRHLLIYPSKWTDSMAEAFSKLQLTSLEIFPGVLEMAHANAISQMPKLTKLHLCRCEIANDAIDQVSKARSLTKLTVWGCPSTDQIVKRFSADRPDVEVNVIPVVGM